MRTFEQLTVDATAGGVPFTAAKITNSSSLATWARCRLETAQIRFTVDGTTPTSSVGTLLEVGDILPIHTREELLNFHAIRTGSSSGVLDCTYGD
jgi:hypothetical protein